MPNDNALEGITCPNCGQANDFQITATATFDVTDEGTGDYQSVEWDDNSPIHCGKCGHMGLIKDFTAQESYVLIHDENGLFLGEVMGLAFWSNLDSLELTEAPSFTREHAQAIADLHEEDMPGFPGLRRLVRRNDEVVRSVWVNGRLAWDGTALSAEVGRRTGFGQVLRALRR